MIFALQQYNEYMKTIKTDRHGRITEDTCSKGGKPFIGVSGFQTSDSHCLQDSGKVLKIMILFKIRFICTVILESLKI